MRILDYVSSGIMLKWTGLKIFLMYICILYTMSMTIHCPRLHKLHKKCKCPFRFANNLRYAGNYGIDRDCCGIDIPRFATEFDLGIKHTVEINTTLGLMNVSKKRFKQILDAILWTSRRQFA